VRCSSREESICGVGGSRPRRYCPPARYLSRDRVPADTPGIRPTGRGRPQAAAPSGLTLWSVFERQQRRPYQILVRFVEPHPAPEFHPATADDRKPIAVHGGLLRVGVTETGAPAMGEDEGAEFRVDAGH
jgi:hypothetical protein